MNQLFPLIDLPELDRSDTSLPLARDIQWDPQTNQPVWQDGNPVWVTGLQAVVSWAARALSTVRGEKDIFSSDYGCDLMSLAGYPYSEQIRQSEAVRLVRECLTMNPYIKDVQQIAVELSGSTLQLSCTLQTVYGEVTIYANNP